MAVAFSDWYPPALVGMAFTGMALLKIYGLRRHIVGGADKPWAQRMLGSCPTWTWWGNVSFVALFMAVGLGGLAWTACVLMRGHG